MGISGGCYLIQGDQGARFSAPLFVRRNSDAIALQRSSRQVTFVHQKYKLLHKSCKARNMLWTGFAGFVTFQLLACTLLRGMLVSKYFGQGELSYFGQLLHLFQG